MGRGTALVKGTERTEKTERTEWDKEMWSKRKGGESIDPSALSVFSVLSVLYWLATTSSILMISGFADVPAITNV
jgi:hypothetical protein